jgi:hypothetical protein
MAQNYPLPSVATLQQFPALRLRHTKLMRHSGRANGFSEGFKEAKGKSLE